MSIGVPGAAMAMPAAPRSAGEPLTKLQLNFSCKGLTNKDSLSKSDPALYVYMLNGAHETLLGITETVTNDLSPQWAYSLVVDYFFERQQMLRFYVVDIDSASKDRSAHDQLGTCDVPLAQIVSGKNGRLTIPLKGKGAGKGTLTVTSEELSGANELLTFSVLAKNIDKKDFLGKSDGFLIFKRAAEDGSWIAVHKTEVVKNSLNPVWKPITISLTQLANGDWDRPLRIELYDWDANSDADYIGQFDTSASALRAAAGGAGFPLINAELAKKKGKKYDNSGVFHVTAFKSEKQHTFVDYLRSGTRINCIVSIDFTASNGVPNFAQSLHYQNPYEPNPYQKAINSVGTVLIDYDTALARACRRTTRRRTASRSRTIRCSPRCPALPAYWPPTPTCSCRASSTARPTLRRRSTRRSASARRAPASISCCSFSPTAPSATSRTRSTPSSPPPNIRFQSSSSASAQPTLAR
jgi:hypothetical protein